MKTIFTILTTVALLAVYSLNAQVAINTDGSSPHSSAMLDIQSTTKGFSLPNFNIADMSTAAPATSPKTGLVAYNTNTSTGPGVAMWTGSKWVMLELEGINWKLTGNEGTTVGTNFLGTTDEESVAFYTYNTERMRVEDDGQIVVNNGYSAPDAEDKFSVTGNTTNYVAIAGYSGVNGGYGVYGADGGDGYGLYGYANGTKYGIYGRQDGSGHAIRGYNAGTGTGVSGKATSSVNAFGMWASNGSSSGTALIAVGNDQTGSYLTAGTGIAGTGADGIYGKGKDSDGTGVIGVGNDNDSIFTLVGGTGGAFTGHSGIYAKVDGSSTGTGVIGAGYNISTVSVTTNGSGGAFTGQDGVLGTAVASSGTGVIGVGNSNNGGSGYVTLSGGSGGAFTGDVCGVYGYASNTSGNRYGGYFAAGGGRYAYVGGRYNGVNRKIVGTGTVNTIVKNTKGEIVTLTCPEAPESLFQDYGIGQLVNGKAHITIDPDLAININVDSEHPLKVFITLEGDCNGVYVTNKSANGFDVIELQGGSSSVPFSWQIVATRANEQYINKDGTIEISDYSKRFQPAPGPLEINKTEKGRTIHQKPLQQKVVEVKDTDKKDKKELEPKKEVEDTQK